MPAKSSFCDCELNLEEAYVELVVAGSAGEGSTSGFERKMQEVRMEVVMREKESPLRLRSRMYQRAGLTRARVRVSWRVDCQGSRRWRMVSF